MAARQRVGVVVKGNSLLASGADQNAVFLERALTLAGQSVTYLHKPGLAAAAATATSTASTYGLPGLHRPLMSLVSPRFPFKAFSTIIFAVAVPPPEFIAECVKHGVRVIDYVCGNLFMFLIEEFSIAGLQRNGARAEDPSTMALFAWRRGAPKAAQWAYDGLRPQEGLLHALTGVQPTFVPHVWSQVVLEMTGAVQPWHVPPEHMGRAHVVVMESNYSTVKSALLPLLVAERLLMDEADAGTCRLDTVHVFDSPQHAKAQAVLGALDVKRRGKVQEYGRHSLAWITQGLSSCAKGVPVFLSHTVYNPHNYLYYELLHLGFALVHNSEPLRDAGLGYYYPQNDVAEAARQVALAAQTHTLDKAEDTRVKARPFLQTLLPETPNVQQRLLAAMKHASK